MDSFDLETSLRKIDSKFADDLTYEEKRKALKKFRKLYAQQMAKLTSEVSKRQKVQENLSLLNRQQLESAKEIDDELRKRMDKHNENRQKRQESKVKEYKLMQENWRRRLDEITRKNKEKEKDAYRKAIKMREEAEEYWHKKSQTVQVKEDHLYSDRKSQTVKPNYHSLSKPAQLNSKPTIAETHYAGYKPAQKARINFPNLKDNSRTDLEGSKHLNRSVGESSINDELRLHQEKCLKEGKEQENDKIQKLMERFEKIEKTRKVAKERIEKQITEAKKLRQLRQNPEFLQANRKKSIAQFHKSPVKKNSSSAKPLNSSKSKSKVNLNESIVRHLQSKKRLVEQQFQERELAFEARKRKFKQTKINRMLKEAINMIKHQALQEALD